VITDPQTIAARDDSILAGYTFVSGLRAPALIAFIDDSLI
jgi:hypothetical protein